MKESNLSKGTVLSALEELEKNKLLIKRKNGFNKKEFKMYPNFYYLLKPCQIQKILKAEISNVSSRKTINQSQVLKTNIPIG